MKDVVIIGGGPAGVSAALYTTRANLTTQIIYKNAGALTKAESIDNFYGNPSVRGTELVQMGLIQAKSIGAELIEAEVVGLMISEDLTHFKITTTDNVYFGKKVILAAGASHTIPKIPGLLAFEGKGVSFCAICDGFFHRGRNVAVLGNAAYALSEVHDLLPIASKVTLLTNGEKLQCDFPKEVEIITDKIQRLSGEKTLEHIVFENGHEMPFSGLFIALGSAGGSDLARKAGALIHQGYVSVDEHMQTNVPGLWAAGDCTGGLKQIAKAVYDGMNAGLNVIKMNRVG